MNLNYITRGNSTPQGKPRVYFTGHPADYKLYFKSIAQELLQRQNCAIYYDQNPELDYDYEDLSFSLEQMQLFVIPVTGKFLTQSNRARNIEFLFAQHAHIPVLPLAQEDGIEEIFNETCGNLQILNKNKYDPTAIPFDEKLTRFLESVLVGDELTKKIRQNFTAYFFLSYRQKDRKYAQELMRLIHKNILCWDIAVWYDEFLVPGEDFSQLIQDALEKSKLFTMVITPNMLEDENYVMTTEYPMACNAGKPILPLEIIPTDLQILQKKFCGIPPCINAYDENAVSQALNNILNGLIYQKETDTSEHNFYIGLAYLNGIDIEVDRDRALSLIVSAANSGLDKAIKKLVDMYRNGDGVEYDYHIAIQWQEKLVKIHQQQYNENKTDENKTILATILCDLGIYLYEIRDLTSAKDVFTQMKHICEELSTVAGNVLHICCLERLGDISKEEGILPKAKVYYFHSMDLIKQLIQNKHTMFSENYLAISYIKVGDIAQSEGNLTQATEYYNHSVEIYKQLIEEHHDEQAQRNLALSYERLGDVGIAEDNTTYAKKYYLYSITLRKQLLEETQTVDGKRELAVAYEKMGDVKWTEGNLPQATEDYLQCLELREQLLQQFQTVQAKNDLAIICHRLGDISLKKADLVQARMYALKGLKLQMQLNQECQTIESRMLLASSYISFGNINKTEGKLVEAKEYYLKSLRICQQLVEDFPTRESRRHLSVCYECLGYISREEKNLQQSKEYYLQAFELCQQLAKETKAIRANENLIFISDILSDISRSEDNLDQAKKYLVQSMKSSQLIYEKTQTMDAKMDLAIRCRELGDISIEEDNTFQAKEYYFQSLKLLQHLAQKEEIEKKLATAVKKNIAIICEILGDIVQGEGELFQAKEYYLKSREFRKQMVEEANTPQSLIILVPIDLKLSALNAKINKKK